MPPSLKDFLAHQESKGTQHKPMADVQMGLLRTAAVSFEHLTNDPHWDRYLSIIQGKYDTAKRDRDVWLIVCGNESNENALRQAQLTYQNLCGYVKALEDVLSLPYEIRNSYEGAKNDQS